MIAAKRIPVPKDPDLAIISRKLRVVLFDPSIAHNVGAQELNSIPPYFLSNVHTINAVWSQTSPDIWAFPSQVRSFLDILLISMEPAAWGIRLKKGREHVHRSDKPKKPEFVSTI